MASNDGLRLEFPDGRAPVEGLAEINDALMPYGSRVWQLDHSGLPAKARKLLAQPTLTEAETEYLMAQFLEPRDRLLARLAEAGRAPQVPGGGEMTTTVTSHGYDYPQLYLVEAGADYSRFDRYHVNTADDGTGVDEFMQVLSGGGVTVLQRLPNHGVLTLRIDCPAETVGWYVTYDGAYPHIGSISKASPGTKVLMQVIGPARWALRYREDEGADA